MRMRTETPRAALGSPREDQAVVELAGLNEDLDVLKSNASEARTLTGVDVRDGDRARAAARQLQGRGARNVIVSIDTGTLLVEQDSER
ncbi:MAG: hypothetical protein DMF84_30345 [Acidobacteria bacterium]|nr:MAG: hypothetical protein DMF84_30345 [Acidobacteriota bacterium]